MSHRWHPTNKKGENYNRNIIHGKILEKKKKKQKKVLKSRKTEIRNKACYCNMIFVIEIEIVIIVVILIPSLSGCEAAQIQFTKNNTKYQHDDDITHD